MNHQPGDYQRETSVNKILILRDEEKSLSKQNSCSVRFLARITQILKKSYKTHTQID